jgi:hypothetical protein
LNQPCSPSDPLTTRVTGQWPAVQNKACIRQAGKFVELVSDEPASQPPFWIAIDPFGEMRSSMAAGADNHRFFVSTKRAARGALARRAPEHHPGMMERPVFVGIRLHRNDVGIFVPPAAPR